MLMSNPNATRFLWSCYDAKTVWTYQLKHQNQWKHTNHQKPVRASGASKTSATIRTRGTLRPGRHNWLIPYRMATVTPLSLAESTSQCTSFFHGSLNFLLILKISWWFWYRLLVVDNYLTNHWVIKPWKFHPKHLVINLFLQGLICLEKRTKVHLFQLYKTLISHFKIHWSIDRSMNYFCHYNALSIFGSELKLIQGWVIWKQYASFLEVLLYDTPPC